MRINTNISSLNAWRNLSSTDNSMSKSLERLSSGFRINRAADDVAGLAISENMRAQIRGLNQAVKNAQDGGSLLQTAEGSLNEVHDMLHRMRELAVQSANGTLQPEDRKQIQTEMDNLSKEVTRITNATQFNSKDLLDGSLQDSNIQSVTLQIGPNSGQTVNFNIGRMDAKSLGISRDVQTASVYDDVTRMSGGSIVASVPAADAIGAGMTAGQYTVKYDDTTKTVQLFDATGTQSIGTAVDITKTNADGTVTIGDVNTAQQINITLQTGALTTGSDLIMVGSRAATVNNDATGIVDLSATNTTGIVAIGWGMQTTGYQLDYNSGTKSLQLQDSTGAAIGSAIYVTNDGTANAGTAAGAITSGDYTIGDAATGRTLTVSFDATATTGTADVDVVNNGQAAEDAKFDGGVKYANSQAFAGLNVSSVTGAQNAITAIDSAIAKVSYQRSQLGAIQNRLEHTINNLQVVSENLTASESRIRDVDMAQEMATFTKQQILMQSGTAMLAQANQKNQAVLSLLR
jgi:flagellin